MPTRHPWRPHISDEHVFNPFVSPTGNPEPEEEEWFDETKDETPDIGKLQAEKKGIAHAPGKTKEDVK